jgi:hypothetical protein
MSGRVRVTYCKAPTVCLYSVGSERGSQQIWIVWSLRHKELYKVGCQGGVRDLKD